MCIQLTHSSWLWEYLYFILLSSSNRSLTYLPLFKIRSWTNGMRFMSFYISIYFTIRSHFCKLDNSDFVGILYTSVCRVTQDKDFTVDIKNRQTKHYLPNLRNAIKKAAIAERASVYNDDLYNSREKDNLILVLLVVKMLLIIIIMLI